MSPFEQSLLSWLGAGSLWWLGFAAALGVWFRFAPPKSAAARHAVLAAAILAATALTLLPRWGNGVVALKSRQSSEAPTTANVEVVQPSVPPIALSDSGASAPKLADSFASAEPAPSPAGVEPAPVDWLMIAGRSCLAVWLAGSLLMLVRLGRAALIASRWRHQAAPLSADLEAEFESTRDEMTLARRSLLRMHAEPSVPMVLCGFPPMVVVPSDWSSWAHESRIAALRHELSHIARRDDWWRLLSESLRVLWWFHPGVHWLLRRREHEAELLSDEAAVSAGCSPPMLAELLLDACRRVGPRRNAWAVPAAQFLSPRTMKIRITRLAEDADELRRVAPRGLRWSLAAVAAVLALLGSMRWVSTVEAAAETKVVAVQPEQQTPDQPRPDTNGKSGWNVHFDVVDAETAQPVRNVRAILGPKRYEQPGRPPAEMPIHWQQHTVSRLPEGVLDLKEDRPWELTNFRFDADGYQPQVVGPIKDDAGELRMQVKLHRHRSEKATVLTPDGKPAVGAQVAIVDISRDVQFKNGRLSATQNNTWGASIIVADAEGLFSLPADEPTALLVAAHESGFQVVKLAAYIASTPLKLSAYGRIEGRAQWGRTPGANETISLWGHLPSDSPMVGPVHVDMTTRTRTDGAFAFERVPADRFAVGRLESDGVTSRLFPIEPLSVVSGQSSRVVVGGEGRPVRGIVAYERKSSLRLDASKVHITVGLRTPSVSGYREWIDREFKRYYEFLRSPIGRNYFIDSVPVAADGTFTIPRLPHGEYELRASVEDEGPFGRTYTSLLRFEIPSMPEGKSDVALDLGRVELEPPRTVERTQPKVAMVSGSVSIPTDHLFRRQTNDVAADANLVVDPRTGETCNVNASDRRAERPLSWKHVRNARVTVKANDGRDFKATATVDGAGQFSLDKPLPPGGYQVDAEAFLIPDDSKASELSKPEADLRAGTVLIRVAAADQQPKEVQLTLHPASFNERVRHADPAKRGPRFEVRIRTEGADASPATVKLWGGIATRKLIAEKTCNIPGAAAFEGISSGVMSNSKGSWFVVGVTVSHPTMCPADGRSWRDVNVSTRPGTVEKLVIRLSPGGFIEGELKNADGTPLANVNIRLLQRVGRDDRYVDYVDTDVQGRFRSHVLSPGEYRVETNNGERRLFGVVKVEAAKTSKVSGSGK